MLRFLKFLIIPIPSYILYLNLAMVHPKALGLYFLETVYFSSTLFAFMLFFHFANHTAYSFLTPFLELSLLLWETRTKRHAL